MAAINKVFTGGLIAIIRFYRFAISALLGHCCRFEPSCSAYAMEAIENYGCLKGCLFAIRRLFRCHPWHPGGIDPVPADSIKAREQLDRL